LAMFLRKLYSCVLLGIFLVFVIHQGFPHVHHEHDKSDHQEIAHHEQVHSHHHANSHHHHDAIDTKQKATNDHYQGLLGFILGDHSHSDGINHRPVITNPVVKGDNAKNLGGALATCFRFSDYTSHNVGYRIIYNPPEFYNNSYTPYFNHRGPPAII